MPFDQPEHRRYTDPRFPSLEIHNDGGRLFVVYEDGEPIDEFSAIESEQAQGVSQEFAQRRAQAYFERMSKGQMSSELLDRPELGMAQPRKLGVRNDVEPMGVEPEAAAPPSRLNWRAKVLGPSATATATTHPTKGKLGSPLPPGERFGGPEDLDALIARARETNDPNLWKQAGSWMAQESAAQRIVRILLSL